MSELTERDQNLIWHPYTQHGFNAEILPIKSAKGAYLELEDGRQILDGISSWWVNMHGHGHPKLAAAAKHQIENLDHVIFAGFTHQPAVDLAEKLVSGARAAGAFTSKVFYSDNGSTAVEVALKMAYQFHVNKTGKARPRFLALRSGYHGDTFGAMAVGEPQGFHAVFRPLMPSVDFVEPDDFGGLEKIIASNPENYAAFIVEPLVQGAGGMRMHSVTFLQRVAALCKENNILLICDEVFTGFYRTGKLFAFSHAGIQPDLICLSKGITGGILPLAATLATPDVFAAFSTKEMSQAFLHGHSYTANPVACRVALESWDLLHSSATQAQIKLICETTERAVTQLKENPLVSDARTLGTIGAVTMKFDFNYMSGAGKWFKEQALQKGVLLRPLGNVLYAVPPYCATALEVERIYQTIDDLIHEYGKNQ